MTKMIHFYYSVVKLGLECVCLNFYNETITFFNEKITYEISKCLGKFFQESESEN